MEVTGPLSFFSSLRSPGGAKLSKSSSDVEGKSATAVRNTVRDVDRQPHLTEEDPLVLLQAAQLVVRMTFHHAGQQRNVELVSSSSDGDPPAVLPTDASQ
eukprot:14399669-Heterocapsa_arctica.AAC.1